MDSQEERTSDKSFKNAHTGGCLFKIYEVISFKLGMMTETIGLHAL